MARLTVINPTTAIDIAEDARQGGLIGGAVLGPFYPVPRSQDRTSFLRRVKIRWHSSLTLRSALAVTVSVLTLAGALTPSMSYAVKQTGGEYNTLYANLGAKGYDVVAYFTDGKPAKGSESYTHKYGGVTWQFSSKEHRDAFAADPAKYAPQYGGFCSWGVSQGKLFDVDPENGWAIVDHKLYLNFNGDIHKTWLKDSRGFISKADKNFPALNR